MRLIDVAVIAAYLVFITWFGTRFRKSQRSLRDYFLGGRDAPWWAIAFSIVSAETSTLTVIGTPAIAFAGNFTFLQLIMGYLLGRIAIAGLFLPQYFRGELFTAYELMERRFGTRVRRFTAGTFLILRSLAEGVRVFAVSLVVGIILQTSDLISIGVIVCLTLFYTFEGGMTAVIWTDVMQMILYVGGALLSFYVLLHGTAGGWAHVVAVAGPLGKFRLFDFAFSFTQSYTFWGGLIGGCFLTMASHGTEQLLVQRLLSARSERESRWALFSSWAVIFFQFGLFLLIGVVLFVQYRDAGRPAPPVPERTYPEFVWQHMPPGISGLIMAAILAAAMSNLSAALNALASTSVMDFLKPLLPGRSEARYLNWSRVATIFWGGVLFGIGLLARHWGRVLEAGLTIASVLYGALLGVFLLGVLTKRPGPNAAITGMLAGFGATLLLRGHVAFTWYVLFGSTVTFIVGYASGFLLDKRTVA